MADLGLSFQGLQQEMASIVASDLGPSLAVETSLLYQIWKGSGGDTRIWFSRFNGSSWTVQQSLPDPIRTSASPGLAALVTSAENGEPSSQLWAAWKSEGSDNSIYFSIYDGAWSEQTQIVLPNSPTVKTTNSPALASFGGLLYFVWKGSPDDGIYWTYFNPSTAV
jgi:hypothetical protein